MDSSLRFYNLLKESWAVLKRQYKNLITISALPFLFFILSAELSRLTLGTPFMHSYLYSVLSLSLNIFKYFLLFWSIPSLIYSIKNNASPGDSYGQIYKVLPDYLRLAFLFIVITLGGYLFFIIPGYIFSIWLSLSFFVFIYEGKKGFSALSRSRQLVKRNFLSFLLGKLPVVPSYVFSIIVLYFLFLFVVDDSLVLFYSACPFFITLFTVYHSRIYENIRIRKAEAPDIAADENFKIGSIFFGSIGSLLFLAIIIMIFLWQDDISVIRYDDLILSDIEVPKEENAYYVFEKAADEMNVSEEEKELILSMIRGGRCGKYHG